MESTPRFRAWTRRLARVAVLALAAVGLCWLVGGPLVRVLLASAYDKQITKQAYSPGRAAVAEVEVTKGGLGTVWTTRVYLRPAGEDGWTVYQTKDSDFTPTLTWKSADTLVIGLPCSRFDYISNPDDWERSDPSERRLKVRFEYVRDCNTPASGDTRRQP